MLYTCDLLVSVFIRHSWTHAPPRGSRIYLPFTATVCFFVFPMKSNWMDDAHVVFEDLWNKYSFCYVDDFGFFGNGSLTNHDAASDITKLPKFGFLSPISPLLSSAWLKWLGALLLEKGSNFKAKPFRQLLAETKLRMEPRYE